MSKHTWTFDRQVSDVVFHKCVCGLVRESNSSGYTYRWGGAVVKAGTCPRIRPAIAVPHVS